jgi:hypothetical protein
MFLITVTCRQLISQSQLRRELEFAAFVTGNGIKKGYPYVNISLCRYRVVQKKFNTFKNIYENRCFLVPEMVTNSSDKKNRKN